MVSRKFAQKTNSWLIRVDFFYTYSWVNGLCFGYFQILSKRSPFDQKLSKRYPLLHMYPDFLTIRHTALDDHIFGTENCTYRMNRIKPYIGKFSYLGFW